VFKLLLSGRAGACERESLVSETLRDGSGLRSQMLTLTANGNNYMLGAQCAKNLYVNSLSLWEIRVGVRA